MRYNIYVVQGRNRKFDFIRFTHATIDILWNYLLVCTIRDTHIILYYKMLDCRFFYVFDVWRPLFGIKFWSGLSATCCSMQKSSHYMIYDLPLWIGQTQCHFYAYNALLLHSIYYALAIVFRINYYIVRDRNHRRQRLAPDKTTSYHFGDARTVLNCVSIGIYYISVLVGIE